ncbi:hypothetical protein BDZ94DRAFT_652436 [Collybia nuda]|uniref:Uncharacterized protein n=1 Tax=Collybia nuda TaxID=64659 RepID=A0A9P5Y5J2_9AGAR|nr:hypothetical protein BDZ94DRAFT_652436 [Collybia nuda]
MVNETLTPSWDESSETTTTTSLVDTLSTTEHSYSTSRTVPGPVALSGKAILALGKTTLRVAENLVIRTRLQALSSTFPHRDRDTIKGIDQMYKDIMELSRRDLYPNVARVRALHIILVQIGSCEVEKLVQYLGKWSSIEIKIFIRKITELFDPLRLVKETGPPSILMQAYRDSVNSREDHHLRPLIYIFSMPGLY